MNDDELQIGREQPSSDGSVWHKHDSRSPNAVRKLTKPGQHRVEIRFLDGAENNFASYLLQYTNSRPDTVALHIPTNTNAWLVPPSETLTFHQFGTQVAAFQGGLRQQGFVEGDRILVLFPPCPELFCLITAMFASGMVPVFLDIGMGMRKTIEAIRDSNPTGVFATTRLLRLAPLFKPLRRTRRFAVDAGDLATLALPNSQIELCPCNASTTGLITFTSGSTSRAKGANRTHHSLVQQHLALGELSNLQAGDSVMTGFPVAALHCLCSGVASVLPGFASKEEIITRRTDTINLMKSQQTTSLWAAPCLMDSLAQTLHAGEPQPSQLRAVWVGGSSVTPAQCKRYQTAFSRAKVSVIYGSTEAEPISLATAEAVQADSTKSGLLVGTPVKPATVRVIKTDTGVVSTEQEMSCLTAGQVGEIVVKGPHVLKEYINNVEATAKYKIRGSDGAMWHRTGDTGYLDGGGRVYLTGRIKDTVYHQGRALHPYCVEPFIDALDTVNRCALLQIDDTVVLAYSQETNHKGSAAQAIYNTLSSLELSDIEVVQVEQIPVDHRHHSKINRPLLRQRLVAHRSTRRADQRWIATLNPIDCLTLSGVFLGLLSTALVLAEQFAFALVVLFGATLCDALDGLLARRFQLQREFGRYLDGFADLLIYLLVPCVFLYVWGFNSALQCLTLLFFVATGVVRLAVFNQIGNIQAEGKKDGYLGMPVFWSVFILAAAYAIDLSFGKHAAFLLTLVMPAYSLAMLYNGYFFKFRKLSHILVLIFGCMGTFTAVGIHQHDEHFLVPVWSALLLILPAVIGGILHMVVVSNNWLSTLAKPINNGWFGANKTWRGPLIMPLLCIPGALVSLGLTNFYSFAGDFPLPTGIRPYDVITLGITMGLAYMLFELPNSFYKRRLGIAPGTTPPRHRYRFIALDQLDSAVGLALAALIFYQTKLLVFLLILVLFPLIALGVKRVLYLFDLKKTAY